MFIDPSSDELLYLPAGTISERNFVEDWVRFADIPSNEGLFESLFPPDFSEETDGWLVAVANDIRSNQQTQLENFSLALNQTFYNKVVSDVGSSFNQWFGGGTLGEFLPQIDNMAQGALSTVRLGSGIIGAAGGENQGAPSDVIQKVENTFNGAIGALSAITAINPIVGAIAAVGFMVAKAAAREAERQRVRKVEADNAFYKGLPKMPTFSKQGDEKAVDLILSQMPENDWTNLFIPRYNPRKEWIGVMHQTGFLFYPGERDGGGWAEGGHDENYYAPTDSKGLGMIPGTQQITGSIQSRLSSYEIGLAHSYIQKGGAKEVDTLWEWAQIQDPKAIGEVTMDTGDFYPSSAQTLSFLWGHMQKQGASGNPDLYKVNCPYIDGQWHDYCEGAWNYVNEMCGWDMYSFDTDGKSIAKLIKQGQQSQNRRRMMEALHSCALACQLGVYRCYSPELGGGLMPGGQYWGRGSTPNCNVGLNSMNSNCRQNIWEAYIHDRVVGLHQMQYQMLSASLVCAYVKESYAAFDPDIATGDNGQALDLLYKLRSMRNALLERPDQWKHLNPDNVPRDEMHEGQNWYDLLESVGAFAFDPVKGIEATPGANPGSGNGTGYGSSGLELSAGEGFDNPAPPVLELVGRIPGQEDLPPKRSLGGSSKSGGGGLVVAGAAALAAFAFLRR